MRRFPRDLHRFAEAISGIAASHGMEVVTCAEPPEIAEEVAPYVTPGKCIDDRLLVELGAHVSSAKDMGQREACLCVQSREIGMYDSCRHGCAFCYATASQACAESNRARHYPDSASMLGWVPDDSCPRSVEQLRLG